MSITISGENNNDRILASDGVIDQISGINIVGLITASHINVGSNIQLGNAGIVTATTFVGNLTGNVNSTSPLLLQTGGSERFRITGNNELGIAGANYGTAGQVLTSGGSGSAVTWSAIPTQVTINNNASNRIITGEGGTTLNGESNLTFDGSLLTVSGNLILHSGGATRTLQMGPSSAGIEYNVNGTTTLQGRTDAYPLAFKTQSVERLRIDSSGRVLIGGTSNSASSHADELQIINTSAEGGISIINGDSSMGHIYFGDTSGTAQGRIDYNHGGNYMRFYTANDERLRIDSAGRLLIGTATTKSAGSGQYAKLNVEGYAGGSECFASFSRAEAASAMSANDEVANLTFNDSAGYEFARIQVLADAATGATDTPGRMVFRTTGDGASSSTERLRITSGGKIEVRGTRAGSLQASDDDTLQLYTASTNNNIDRGAGITFYNHDNSGYEMGGTIQVAKENGTADNVAAYMRFSTRPAGGSATERLRIASGGEVSIGGFTPTAGAGILQIAGGLRVAGSGAANDTTTPYIYRTSGVDNLNFATSGVERLRIQSNGRILIGNGNVEQGCSGNLDIVGDTNSNGPELYLRVSNNNTTDNIGALLWGNNVDKSICMIRGETHTANNTGELNFHTSTAGSLASVFRIHSNGDVSIPTVGAKIFTNNSGGNLTIQGGASYPGSAIKFNGGTNGGTGVMHFYAGQSGGLEERMRIENLGDGEFGFKFLDNKAIEFKSQDSGIFSNTWYINANTWTNFFSIPDYFQAWVFLNSTHNAGNSSALWSFSKSSSGGAHCNRFAHDNLYSPASVTFRINGVWVQIHSSYATYGYAIINATSGGHGVANLSG